MHGADPEFVIVDKDGKPVPAHKAGIGGKDNKHKTAAGLFFRDGYNLEINPLPSTCRAILGNNVRTVLREASRYVAAHGYTLSTKTFFQVDMKDLEDAPPDVVEFGCNPSYDAWDGGRPKMVSLNGRTFSRRMTGGHLHLTTREQPEQPGGLTERFGTDKTWAMESALRTPGMYPVLVQKFDQYVGVPLAVVFSSDEQWERRRFYGAAGDYRPQRHPAAKLYPEDKDEFYVGVEYRTPPSDLFRHHALVALAFGVMRWVVQEMGTNPEFARPVSDKVGKQVRDAINKGKDAMDLVESVPGYYNRDTIAALSKVEDIRGFEYLTGSEECHSGWNEYAQRWSLPREGFPPGYFESRAVTRYSDLWTYSHGFYRDWGWAWQ